jgi:hypothetical protein
MSSPKKTGTISGGIFYRDDEYNKEFIDNRFVPRDKSNDGNKEYFEPDSFIRISAKLKPVTTKLHTL